MMVSCIMNQSIFLLSYIIPPFLLLHHLHLLQVWVNRVFFHNLLTMTWTYPSQWVQTSNIVWSLLLENASNCKSGTLLVKKGGYFPIPFLSSSLLFSHSSSLLSSLFSLFLFLFPSMFSLFAQSLFLTFFPSDFGQSRVVTIEVPKGLC
jgi:hypothetical protein